MHISALERGSYCGDGNLGGIVVLTQMAQENVAQLRDRRNRSQVAACVVIVEMARGGHDACFEVLRISAVA